MVKKYTLNNGVRVAIEKIPYVKSVSFGIWVKVGSINENINTNGMSHFIEHMLFKGTTNRTAKEIAIDIDKIGGQINAFTSKECTCYYTKVLDNHLDKAIEVLLDMLFNSEFDENEMAKEKKVVLEEIYMHEDSPDDKVYDLLSETIFNKHPLGQPILGKYEKLKDYNRESLVNFLNNNYINENIVISIAGNVDEDNMINMLEKKFNKLENKKNEVNIDKATNKSTGFVVKNKDIEQLHLCFGLKGEALKSERLYALAILNNVLGGSMSSRLFQNIREDKGMAYSIFSYPSSYVNTGLFTIYSAISPKHLEEVSKIIIDELNNLKNNSISLDEFNMAKEQLKGNYILGLESVSSRMVSIGKSLLLIDKVYTPSEIVEKIDRITMDDIKAVIEDNIDISKMSIAAVGNIDKDYDLSKLVR